MTFTPTHLDQRVQLVETSLHFGPPLQQKSTSILSNSTIAKHEMTGL